MRNARCREVAHSKSAGILPSHQLSQQQPSLSQPSIESAMSSGATVNDECISLFNALKLQHTYRFLLFTFNDDMTSIVPDKSVQRTSKGGSNVDLNADESRTAYEDFIKTLPADDCRYAVFDLDFNLPEGRRNKICFFCW